MAGSFYGRLLLKHKGRTHQLRGLAYYFRYLLHRLGYARTLVAQEDHDIEFVQLTTRDYPQAREAGYPQ